MTNEDPNVNHEEADSKADVRAILAIFTVLVVGAVYFVSGWHFDF